MLSMSEPDAAPAPRSSSAIFAQPRRLRDKWVIVEEQSMTRPQHVAMQCGLVEDQRVDRA